ncbi:hypothetical protein NFI96_002693 [Prochilodus magdalenae]|nr:hypothetical protein NFI96_002693 [Prochilodus magdalenae]
MVTRSKLPSEDGSVSSDGSGKLNTGRSSTAHRTTVPKNKEDTHTRNGPPQDHHRAGMMWVVDQSQHCSDTDVVVVC